MPGPSWVWDPSDDFGSAGQAMGESESSSGALAQGPVAGWIPKALSEQRLPTSAWGRLRWVAECAGPPGMSRECRQEIPNFRWASGRTDRTAGSRLPRAFTKFETRRPLES